jgi:hypothetical protein
VVQALWQQCFESKQQQKLVVRSHFLVTVPEDALDSPTFCFSAALTQQHDDKMHYAAHAYAVSDVVCILLTMLHNNSYPVLVPDNLISSSHFASSLAPSISTSISSSLAAAKLLVIQPYPLPSSIRRVCYFSHYDSSGNIAPHTLHLIDSILLLGFRMVLVSCSPSLNPIAQRQLQLREVTYVLLTSSH